MLIYLLVILGDQLGKLLQILQPGKDLDEYELNLSDATPATIKQIRSYISSCNPRKGSGRTTAKVKADQISKKVCFFHNSSCIYNPEYGPISD